MNSKKVHGHKWWSLIMSLAKQNNNNNNNKMTVNGTPVLVGDDENHEWGSSRAFPRRGQLGCVRCVCVLL